MDQTTKSAFKKVALLVALALAICIGVYFFMGKQSAFEFLGAYLIEFSLSIDNLFVFITVFTAFRVPVKYQHRALAWGIWTAVVLRFIFIFLGVSIVERFTWVLYIFGFILIWSGYKMFKGGDEEKDSDVTHNMGYRLLRKIMPVTEDFVDNRFIAKMNGKWHATPLLAALMVFSMVACGGEGKTEEAAKRHGLPLLAQMPIDPKLAALVDAGRIEDFEGNWLQGVADGLSLQAE